MVLDKPLDSGNAQGSFPPGIAGSNLQNQTAGDDSFRSGFKPWQKLRPSIEILCNNQASYIYSYQGSHIFSFLDAKIEQFHALFVFSWPTLQLMLCFLESVHFPYQHFWLPIVLFPASC